VRFLVHPPENSYINATGRAAVSPDGRHLTFVAPGSNGKDVLWVRSFDSLAARSLAGTEGALFPFWSPDSRWIGFFANRSTLQKIDITGGPPISVASALAGNGGTWSRDGVIVFGTGATRLLYRVSAAGGEVVPLTKREKAVTIGRLGPYFLPDGNHYLYEGPQSGAGHAIYVSSLDSDTSKLLVHGGSSPAYQQGYLLYLLGTTLIAQPLDEKRLEIAGDASAVAEQVQFFSASQTGAVLAYWTGAAENMPQLTWFDRNGNRIGKLGDPVRQFNIRLSPDGTKVAAEIYDRQVSSMYFESDIWLYDVSRGVRSRLTSGPGSARVPCWSADGKHIIFSSDRKGHYDLYEKAVDGGGNEELVLESEIAKYCQGWSPDNKFLLFMTVSTDSSANRDIWTLPLFGDRKPVPYLQTEFNEGGGRFSPDGKWVAYSSDESGKLEVYVRPFPGPGGKLLVSASGGSTPVWSHDGKEIFYLGDDRKLMAARVKNGSTLGIDVARPLFQTSAESFLPSFDVSPDGRRFIIVTATPQKSPSPITVVVNWNAGLKKQ
jgi:Tol biopolymer transport system component